MNTIGGLTTKITFHEVKDIISMEINHGHVSISLVAGAIPINLEIVPFTGNYTVGENTIDGEIYYEGLIKGVVSDVNRTNSGILTKIKNSSCIAINESLTGNKKVFGTKDQPITFNFSERISDSHVFNGYDISISSNSETLPPFLT